VAKEVDELTIADLSIHPVWEFVAWDETAVKPVAAPPLDLANKLVGLEVSLASGANCWAIVGNVDIHSEPLTNHFMTISFYANARWHLPRYFDADFISGGPASISAKFELTIEQMFPVTIDLRPYVAVRSTVLFRHLNAEPARRLSRAELIDLAVKRLH